MGYFNDIFGNGFDDALRQSRNENFNAFMNVLNYGSQKDKVKQNIEAYQNGLDKLYREQIFHPEKKRDYEEQINALKQMGFKVLRNSIGQHLIKIKKE